MNRRNFLKVTAAVPAIAVLPAITVVKADEKAPEVEVKTVTNGQGWPKLMVGDVVVKSEMHDGFLLVHDTQTIQGMIVAADDYTYTVSLIDSPDTKRLWRHASHYKR